MSTIRTHNFYHLGDQLVHLNFLRRVALANPDDYFIHACDWSHIGQLREVISDLPNIKLEEAGYALPNTSIDAWRGSENFWYSHPDRKDFVEFHLKWFDRLADKMGLDASPINKASDMLFDYPALNNPPNREVDILVINCPPLSGQFQGYDANSLTQLANTMAAKHKVAMVTPMFGESVTKIGALSLRCHTIVAVSTGPSWPTFNVWNTETVKHRVLLIDSERVNILPNVDHASSTIDVMALLQGYGLL